MLRPNLLNVQIWSHLERLNKNVLHWNTLVTIQTIAGLRVQNYSNFMHFCLSPLTKTPQPPLFRRIYYIIAKNKCSAWTRTSWHEPPCCVFRNPALCVSDTLSHTLTHAHTHRHTLTASGWHSAHSACVCEWVSVAVPCSRESNSVESPEVVCFSCDANCQRINFHSCSCVCAHVRAHMSVCIIIHAHTHTRHAYTFIQTHTGIYISMYMYGYNIMLYMGPGLLEVDIRGRLGRVSKLLGLFTAPYEIYLWHMHTNVCWLS